MKLVWVGFGAAMMFLHRIYDGADRDMKKAFCGEHKEDGGGKMEGGKVE